MWWWICIYWNKSNWTSYLPNIISSIYIHELTYDDGDEASGATWAILAANEKKELMLGIDANIFKKLPGHSTKLLLKHVNMFADKMVL